MRKILFILAAFMLLGITLKAQTIITVDNNPGSGAMYTNLQTAIDNAMPGDILHVSGSATNYGGINVGKQLTIIGAGINNPYGEETSISAIYLNRTNIELSASGSVLKGLRIDGGVYPTGSFPGGTAQTQTITNVTFERCVLFIYFGSYSYSDITVRNSWVFAYNSVSGSNIVFENNVFSAGYFNSIYCTSLFLRNNIFLNLTSNIFAGSGSGVVIENNIFYGAKPQGITGASFNNNITYMCIDNVIPGTGNVGSGNLVNQDPKFVNFPLAGGAFAWTYDFHLKPESPCIGAGTDGTDIGIYGGNYPVEPFGANPNIPQMMEISFPENQSTAPVGGTLNVNFKATKRN
ncbi:MAG: hypothetical protein AB9842_05105 [Bacteroidales bacterium]